MKLENQVVNLELSKKLKELGVKQESLFYWCERTVTGSKTYKEFFLQEKIYVEPYPNIISAFTVAELGEMLPNTIRKNEKDYFLNCYFSPLSSDGGTDFEVSYESGDDKTLAYISNEPNDMIESEANARAKMLIYLLENKLL